MFRTVSLLLLIVISCRSYLAAQCTFTPTVIPGQPILCPGASDTLWTQVYDSYQWYKNNNPVAGATNQFHVITQNDMLKQFKVAATLDGCTENSASVLVDGWVFLLPYVIQSGDQGTFDPNTQSFILCPGDTMILEMGQPYVENVQWFNNGQPIPGANNTMYYVTQSGSYTSCGAPSVCPDYQDCMLIPIDVVFSNTPQPMISQSNDTLFSSAAPSYQWSFNGNLIPGATSQFYVPSSSGSYSVTITDNFNCSIVSGVFNYVATGTWTPGAGQFSFSIFPNPAREQFSVLFQHTPNDNYVITVTDLLGVEVTAPQKVSGSSTKAVVKTGLLRKGNYIVRVSNEVMMSYAKLLVH